MNCPLIFLTLGEWIEANIGTLITLAGFAVTGLIAFIRLQSQVSHHDKRMDSMDKLHDEHERDIRNHTGDSEKHVNHLHMRAMEHRIDKIDSRMDKMEITMTNGFDKTMSRLDVLLKRD